MKKDYDWPCYGMRPIDKKNSSDPKENGVIGVRLQEAIDLQFKQQNLKALYRIRLVEKPASVSL
jgi:hypothetical protein